MLLLRFHLSSYISSDSDDTGLPLSLMVLLIWVKVSTLVISCSLRIHVSMEATRCSGSLVIHLLLLSGLCSSVLLHLHLEAHLVFSGQSFVLLFGLWCQCPPAFTKNLSFDESYNVRDRMTIVGETREHQRKKK